MTMKHILLRGGTRVIAWAMGLLLAASVIAGREVVPGLTLHPTGFIVAWAVFSIVMGVLSMFLLKLPQGYASLAMGTAAMIMTFVSLWIGAMIVHPHGLEIDRPASWVATGVIVWLVTSISATLVPDVYTYPGAEDDD